MAPAIRSGGDLGDGQADHQPAARGSGWRVGAGGVKRSAVPSPGVTRPCFPRATLHAATRANDVKDDTGNIPAAIRADARGDVRAHDPELGPQNIPVSIWPGKNVPPFRFAPAAVNSRITRLSCRLITV